MDPNELSALTQTLEKYTSGVILLPTNASQDSVAAATALYLGLTKLGKNIALASSAPVQSDMVGADKITQDIATAGDNLVISFPYEEGSIDKVDYNIVGDKFNLIITPHGGESKIKPKDVKFAYSGGSIEFVITIDTPSVRSLGPIYTENQKQLQGKFLINIDRHLANSFYGSVNIVKKNASSTSELILNILTSLQVELDQDIASNLYAGIASATNNFSSYSVNADTFETAAALLKSGAKKKQGVQSARQGAINQPQRQATPPSFVQQQEQRARSRVQSPPANQKEARAIEDIEPEMDDDEDDESEDWLKPNIFGGGAQGTNENSG